MKAYFFVNTDLNKALQWSLNFLNKDYTTILILFYSLTFYFSDLFNVDNHCRRL